MEFNLHLSCCSPVIFVPKTNNNKYSQSCIKRSPLYSQTCIKRSPLYSQTCIKRSPLYSQTSIKRSPLYSQTCIKRSHYYNQTCIKRLTLGQRKSGLIRQVTSYERFNSYEIFYDRTRKG